MAISRNRSFTGLARGTWPRAAVFDCDGLLVDSSHCWRTAYLDLCHDAGIPPTQLDVAALAGASIAGAATGLTTQLGILVSDDALRPYIERAFLNLPPRPMRGACELLAKLAGRLPLAVATNAPGDLAMQALGAAGLTRHLSAIVSVDDVAAGKPAPDPYLEACRALGVDPSDSVAFEDSATGASAARAAGLLLIAVPTPGPPFEADLTVGRLDDPRILDLFGDLVHT